MNPVLVLLKKKCMCAEVSARLRLAWHLVQGIALL